MAVGKELFKLFGLIGMQGVEEVKNDLKKIDRQVRRTQKEIDRFGRGISDVGKMLTKAFTLPMIAAAVATTKFIDDATDLNETISKTGEIFGTSAKDIESWAELSATKLGQSKTQAMDAASTFGIMGKSAGLAGKDLLKFSTEFVELSSDMASFFNTEPDQAITAIGAAFRGETEPIRKYGVMLDDATMRQKAFELGLTTSTKNALMPQTKILAAQALILEQTKVAQGDFARTSAGLANQKRILNAQIKNVSASLGQLFLPVALKIGKIISRLVGLTERLIDWWKNLDDSNKKMIKGFGLIAFSIGPVLIGIGKLISLSRVLIPLLFNYKAAIASINKSFMAWTIVIASLVALGWYWYSQWDKLSIQLKAVWAKVALFLIKTSHTMIQAFTDVLLSALNIASKISGIIPGLGKKIENATLSILKYKASLFRDLAKEQAYTNQINEQAEATGTLTDNVKKAIKEAKDLIGIKEEATKKTQKEIELEKMAADEAKKLAEKKAKDAIEFEKSRLEYEKSIQQQINEMTLTKLELLELERQEALRIAEEKGAGVLAVSQLYALKEQELKDQIRAEEAAKDEQAMRERLRRTSQIGNKLNNVLARFSDNKLARLDIEEKKQIQAVKNSQLTEEQKQAAIQKIEDTTEKKRQKLERERAIREKLAALFNIAVNTASAVVEALPNIPLSIAIGALGAAEGVAVATTPLPFAEGGLVQGSDKGVNSIIGEKNQDELVFPLERGIGLLVDGLTERFNEIKLPEFRPTEFAGTATPAGPAVNLNIGTLVADERGLKELERRMESIRISENIRKGF